ncbi:hypothetical protein LK459_00450 [Gordonia otitidis]|uniref:hypothetical protein n=1 Tax=Gordonia otitidis TaxID=249058 RepID=UPI001D15521D|nr:hypothetical protein [Gordonia otitidis]UEA59430.1 hypothetical protein LK459_00450 [Gordonia otitidis]
MTFRAPTSPIHSPATATSRRLRVALTATASIALVPLGAMSAPEASAVPAPSAPHSTAPHSTAPQSGQPHTPGARGSSESDTPLPTPGPPMPVPDDAYGYLATHDLTVRMNAMNLPQAVAALPVPDSYRPANLAFAGQFDRAVTAALAAPGGCVQVIINSHTAAGNLFDYGFFPIEPKYCP